MELWFGTFACVLRCNDYLGDVRDVKAECELERGHFPLLGWWYWKLLREAGPWVHSPVGDSGFGGELDHIYQRQLHRSGGDNGAEPTLPQPLQRISKHSKGSGDLTGTKGGGLSQLCDIGPLLVSESVLCNGRQLD